MSKGFGVIQSAILAHLGTGKTMSTIDLVLAVYQIPADPDDGFQYYTEAQHAAVRRALYGLEKRGLVMRTGREHAVLWASPKAMAAARVEKIRTVIQLTLDEPHLRRELLQLLHEQGIDGGEIHAAAKDLIVQWTE